MFLREAQVLSQSQCLSEGPCWSHNTRDTVSTFPASRWLVAGMNGAAFFCFGAGRGGAGIKIHGAGHFRGGACRGGAGRGKQYVNAEVNVLF